jgi:predicted nucleic acid-binding protein
VKILLDTSTLVAAMVEAHPMHLKAFAWLKRARAGEFEFLVASHTLAELYAALTSLPVSPRIASGTAWRLIRENVLGAATVVSLSAADYRSALAELAELGVTGGAVYDALIARAAAKAGADKLITLNPDDFRRAAPSMADVIADP